MKPFTQSIVSVLLLSTFTSSAAVLIDLDLNTPGVQNSITNATEGQVIEIALIVTTFTSLNPCMNGIGGDISSRGTMAVTFESLAYAGAISDYTNEGFSKGVSSGNTVNSGSPLLSLGLSPLPGYSQNLGGVGIIDPSSNLNLDNELFSFTGVPGGSVSYAMIFRTSITVTNVSGKTLELFPSGIFDNPGVTTMGNEVELNPSGIPTVLPSQFSQEGSLTLHTESHDFQDCSGVGYGALVGATITGVPEPSTPMLAGAFAWLTLMRRKRF